MRTHPKQGPTESRQCVFVVGILVEARCYYRTKHDNATWGAVREQCLVPPHFFRPALRPHSQPGVRPRFRWP